MSGLAIQYGDGQGLASWRDPEQVLAEATRAAEALTRVIALKPKPVIFNGEQYLELEDWQTVGKFYGLTTKVLETRYVEYGGVAGWEAVAVCIDRNGMEVSRAESMCMTDEDNWGNVPTYEWQDVIDEKTGKKVWDDNKKRYKSNRVQTGAKPKPTFQLRSMAQTRACGKAFRQVLSWVVVLGGFKPNVAEEMIESQLGPEQEKAEAKPPVTQPKRASDKAKAEQVQDSAILVIEGSIAKSKTGKDSGAKATMWITVGDKLLVAGAAFIHEEMVEGNHLKVEATEAKSDKIGVYYKITKVLECSSVQEGEIVEEGGTEQPQEDEAGNKTYFAAEPEAEGQQVLEGLKATGAVKPASEVVNKKEQAWKAHVGHDPAVHISYKQGGLFFSIANAVGYNDDERKNFLKKLLGIDHSYLIPKDRFQQVLDTIDANGDHHEIKE